MLLMRHSHYMPVLRTTLIATYVLPQLTVHILHRDWKFKKTYPEKYSNNAHAKEYMY